MASQENKYLTLKLSDESYAIPILKVMEIIGMMPITRVPRLPEHIKGVINLRGKIIPVIDLRLRFGLDEKEYDERTAIIVAELMTETGVAVSGLVVDSVQEVLEIPQKDISPPPKRRTQVDTEFLTGMGKIGEKVVMMLDVDKILTGREEKDTKNK